VTSGEEEKKGTVGSESREENCATSLCTIAGLNKLTKRKNKQRRRRKNTNGGFTGREKEGGRKDGPGESWGKVKRNSAIGFWSKGSKLTTKSLVTTSGETNLAREVEIGEAELECPPT